MQQRVEPPDTGSQRARPQYARSSGAPEARLPRQRPPRPASLAARIGWGAAGFLVGAIFWHFVGFWTFLSEVAFNRQVSSETRYIAQTGADCVALVRDPDAGTVISEPCPDDALPLNETAQSAKGDFGGPRSPRSARSFRLSDGSR